MQSSGRRQQRQPSPCRQRAAVLARSLAGFPRPPSWAGEVVPVSYGWSQGCRGLRKRSSGKGSRRAGAGSALSPAPRLPSIPLPSTLLPYHSPLLGYGLLRHLAPPSVTVPFAGPAASAPLCRNLGRVFLTVSGRSRGPFVLRRGNTGTTAARRFYNSRSVTR